MMEEISLRKALEDYKTVYMAYRNFAVRTREEYLNDLEDLVQFLEKSGIEFVGKISLAPIERYLAELERRGFAGSTRKRKTVTIRSFLMFLYKDEHIASNLAKHLIPPFVSSTTPTFLTETEYNCLRDACDGNTRDRAIVEILLQTGIRLSELTRLTINDIEIGQEDPGEPRSNAYIRIKGSRSRRDRIIPLNEKACRSIKAHLEERPNTGSPNLFINRFGQPFGDRGVQKMLRKYLKIAGIGGASICTLRHTFAVQHITKGTHLKTIQSVMGHTDLRSTSKYVSLVRELSHEL